MGRKIKVKELYFYKKENDLYAVDVIHGKNNNHSPKVINNLTRSDINEMIKDIIKNKHSKFEESSSGLKIYNESPDENILSHNPVNIVDVYLNNLRELQESDESRQLAANLLRAAADILSYNDNSMSEPVCPPIGTKPEPAISLIVPFDVINFVQEKLNVSINVNDLTFIFNSQKWQLQKAIDDTVSPKVRRPTASNTITSSMNFIKNLLGVNGENSVEIDEHFFTFPLMGDVYKISFIYTGDHNTIPRD